MRHALKANHSMSEVGPGKPPANIGEVPWESLQPSDTVLIYHRATPGRFLAQDCE